MELVDRVRPARVGRAGHVHRRTLVCVDQPVALHRNHDRLRGARVLGGRDAALQPEPHPVRGQARSGVAARAAVPRRRRVRSPRLRQRDADRVLDPAARRPA